MKQKALTILFMPDYRDGNPYQRELAEAVQRQGHKVIVSNKSGRSQLLKAVSSQKNVDILHLHWTDSFIMRKSMIWTLYKSLQFIAELSVLKRHGLKVVWTVHNMGHHEKLHPRFELFFNRFLCLMYDQIIVLHNDSKHSLMGTLRLPDSHTRKIHVIPHGHYIGSYPNEISRDQAREQLNIDRNAFVFLFFGLIRPYKGLSNLIRSFQRLDNPRCRLLIAGKVSDASMQRELVNLKSHDKRILLFPEFIPDDRIQIFMNASDIAVLPFTQIHNSGSAILAMSFRKALIVPLLGGLRDLCIGSGSIVYDRDEPDALLNSMRTSLYQDTSAMGRINYETIRKYDWETIAEQTIEVYRRIEP